MFFFLCSALSTARQLKTNWLLAFERDILEALMQFCLWRLFATADDTHFWTLHSGSEWSFLLMFSLLLIDALENREDNKRLLVILDLWSRDPKDLGHFLLFLRVERAEHIQTLGSDSGTIEENSYKRYIIISDQMHDMIRTEAWLQWTDLDFNLSRS